MRRGRPGHGRIAILAVVALLFAPAVASGHGDEAGGDPAIEEGGPVSAEEAEEAEIAELARQPARILAQQALALLEIRGDEHEAMVRLEAALESEDPNDVDPAALADAAETLDRGDLEAAIPLIDSALSRPLGSEEGKPLHEGGREFQPGSEDQEIIAILLGAAALLLGAGLLLRGRWAGRAAPR